MESRYHPAWQLSMGVTFFFFVFFLGVTSLGQVLLATTTKFLKPSPLKKKKTPQGLFHP